MKKYNLKKSRIPIILIILFTMIINGCLTMQYYPAKVAKPGKMYLGIGIHEETEYGWEGDYIIAPPGYSAFFLRYGLPHNFDIGFDIHSLLIIPYLLSVSGRKQFDFSNDNNDLIHSITFDIGLGIGLGAQGHTSISFIRDDFALTFGLKKYVVLAIPGGSDLYRNEFLIKISKNSKDKRYNVMPFLYYKAVQEYDIYSNEPGSFMTYIERTGWNNKQIGIGISFFFDLL